MSVEGAAAVVGEPSRLAAVSDSGLVGSEPEEPFDRLTVLASLVFDVPVAVFTVIDHEQAWVSANGLPANAERSIPVEQSFFNHVIATGETVLVDDVRGDARTLDHAPFGAIEVVAFAGAPIRATSGEILGVFCVMDTAPHAWTAREAVILETLAAAVSHEIALRAALAGEHEARDSAERAADEAEIAANASSTVAATLRESGHRSADLARTLQQSLLPPHLPVVPGVDLAAHYLPAAYGEEVVGDFYDVFESSPGSWCVLLGDVCGKGPEAAAVTAMARYTLRAAAVRTVRPSKVLGTLNTALLHQRTDEERYLTVAFGCLRKVGGKLVMGLSSAGHPKPLVRRAGGHVEVGCPTGMPLGLFDRPTLRDARIELEPGDAVVFYSDGVTEARRERDEFGIDRLVAAIAGAPLGDAASLVQHIHAAVAGFRHGLPRDDTAVLVVQVPPFRPCYG